MNTDFPKEAYKKAADYCAKNEHCRQQVEDPLLKYKVSSSDIELICDQLEKEGFIDNLRFAKLFAISKLNQNSWGKIKIKYQLKQLHLSENHISVALTSLSDELYEDVLRKTLQKATKTRPCKSRNDQQKIISFALSKGFEIDLILKIMKQIVD